MNIHLLKAIEDMQFEDTLDLAAYKAMPFFNAFRPGWSAINPPTVEKVKGILRDLLYSCAETDSDHCSTACLSVFVNQTEMDGKQGWVVSCKLDLNEAWVSNRPTDSTGFMDADNAEVESFPFDFGIKNPS